MCMLRKSLPRTSKKLNQLMLAKAKWKYKIFFALYKVLHKKLYKKGLVNHQNLV
ncbi:hypothetical protein [Helicobacter sp. UBA3407]|uniref:hypothetical protein n=1 Tax=Helicobacter sp. UBA3407 TaxID=1946588 RepID=UPI00260ABFAB|nr:hypothetical protein [Helicobacter sp. UBA3407]